MRKPTGANVFCVEPKRPESTIERRGDVLALHHFFYTRVFTSKHLHNTSNISGSSESRTAAISVLGSDSLLKADK